MWNKEKVLRHPCTECGARLPYEAEACPECGYPVIVPTYPEQPDSFDTAHSTMMEYKLIQLLGAVVFCVGIVAVLADSPIAATIAITIGIGTYLTGLLGSWWNRGN